jgi:class 3 adenylate cyclase
MLNALFDAQAKAINDHGGEILKFIGDGLLSIFPIETILLKGVAPRVFSGIFQQYLEYQSHMHRRGDPSAPRYRYVAGELSIPCPGGLSGGPIFRSEQPDVVLAVVTENIDAMTLLEAIEQSQGEGTRLRTEYNRVITYGAGLLVAHVGDWLDRQISGETVQR